MGNELIEFRKTMTRGGALRKEFERTRLNEELDWRMEMSYALTAIQNNEKLQACTPTSVGRALIDLGVMGLSLSPARREAYLIPYGRECTASPSYMGLEQMAYRTGFIEDIQTNLVHKNDVFETWTDDEGPHIKHIEATGDRGDITHAYCVARFSSNRRSIQIMNMAELMACKNAAQKKNGGKVPFTWEGPFKGEMFKKCPLRRAWKNWPRVTSPKLTAMLEAAERTDPLSFEDDKVVEEARTLDQGHIAQLVQMLEEAGAPKETWDQWLQGLANNIGYPRQSLRAVVVRDFERAVSTLARGIEVWKQRKLSRSHPASGPGASTSPSEVT
jgi:recombinational DNA repair protein RecT